MLNIIKKWQRYRIMITNLQATSNTETQKILKKAISANRALARLNGTAKMIPNQNILIGASK